ncbi:interleukin-12 subunit beta [Polymixia lowei]
MRAFLLMVLYVALHSGSCNNSQNSIDMLMDHVLVLRTPDIASSKFSVPLTCGEAYQDQPVFWKKNGKEPRIPLKGNQVQVPVEETNGGKYTCHLSPDGQYLNHTLVLVQLTSDKNVILKEKQHGHHAAEHIHCAAHNYNGSYHCTWERTESRSGAAVLLVKAARDSEEILCELDADSSGVRCHHDSCLKYKEEQHPIVITVYIHSAARLEAYATSFYLRDIVRPQKLPNLRYEDDVFHWDMPDSWEKPCTFYSLQYQVKVIQRDGTETGEIIEQNQYRPNVSFKKYGFQVRAQDRYTKGPWSEWSHYEVKRNKHH